MCSSSNECQSGACTLFYKDADGDGYGGTLSAFFCGISPPGGYVTNNTDCCDSDFKAHPGQIAWFTSIDACSSWDYDCSGTVELEYKTGFSGCTFGQVCGALGGNGHGEGFPCAVGTPTPGWAAPAGDAGLAFVAAGGAPGCGQVGILVNGCNAVPDCCACGNQTYCVFSVNNSQAQGCH
jgi:hypothetical protein